MAESFQGLRVSYSREVRRIADKILSLYSVSIYTAIAQTRNINIEASLRLLETISTEKRSYHYTKFYIFNLTNTSTIYPEVTFISSLHYLCLLNQFSGIITIQVLAVGIPHAEATT